MQQMLQQLQQMFGAEYEVYQAQTEKLQKVQKFEQQTGQVAGMNQKPRVVQFEMTTAHSVAKPVGIEMDPTLNSFRGMDLVDIEDHNQVEGRVDNMIDQKAVGNLDIDTDLGVDNPQARTDTGVDLEVHTDIDVDFGVHIDTEVDLGVHIDTEVEW